MVLVKVLLSWDKDVMTGADKEQALEESLCNLQNPINGNTPLLECLTVILRMLVRGAPLEPISAGETMRAGKALQ